MTMANEELESMIESANPDQLLQLLENLPDGIKSSINSHIRMEMASAHLDPEISALYLAAGTGERAPGSRKGPGYIRAKPAIAFLNKRLIHWQLEVIRGMGIDYVIIHGRLKENRQQIKNIIGYGETYGVKVRYTPSRFDLENTGSAGRRAPKSARDPITPPYRTSGNLGREYARWGSRSDVLLSA